MKSLINLSGNGELAIDLSLARKSKKIVLFVACMAATYFMVYKTCLEFNSIVSIKNNRWQVVRVQVRKGFNPDPLKDKLIFDQLLVQGQSRTFTVDNGDDILYRRDQDPNHPDGVHFTRWTYADCGN